VFYQEPEDLGTQLRIHQPRRNRSPPEVPPNLQRNVDRVNRECLFSAACRVL